jgi:hypothetical protein
MVGLSMSDPNLRRLLEIAHRGVENARHFAFMKRLGMGDFVYEKSDDGTKQRVLPDDEKAASFLERHHALTEVLMQELGVTVIWYENYEEIPATLNAIGFPGRVAQ